MRVDGVEVPLLVTIVAGDAETALVHVVTPVTIDATPVLPAGFAQWLAVTGMAMRFRMGVTQFESGFVVIELPDQPVVRVVTVGTVPAECLAVCVIVGMAVDTFDAGIAKYRTQVTGFATDRRVLPDQRKFSQVMIETHVHLPADFVMAAGAIGALFLCVAVVELVTAVTIGIDFLGFGADCMAGRAGEVGMGAVEREIGICIVIEFRVCPAPR